MAHGPGVTRMYTAPSIPPSSRTSRDPFPKTMGHGPRSSKMSSSTLASASTASLQTLATTATNNSTLSSATTVVGQVVATNNIINQRADASRSLYQICVNLRQRLLLVPGFEAHIREAEENASQDVLDDPVESIWQCLKMGYPLLTIYNALQPAELLTLDTTVSDAKRPKSAAFKFVQACLKDLKLPPGECFVLSDLFGDDTTGFVKVTQVLHYVLDLAEQKGLLLQPEETAGASDGAAAGGKMSYRDHVVRELVDTERKYVQDLENLHELKKAIEQKGVIPGDVVHEIFLNINSILDFQRRFLIRIETTNSLPEDRQEWGAPFVAFEEAFSIYQPFIANQRKAADIAKREFDKLKQADHPVVVDFNTLDGFLLKPMQRLVKYPLLLKDLRDKTNADEITKADLNAGIDASNRVLTQANAAVDRELRNEALVELRQRVDDWKTHNVNHFGDLLLHGVFTVMTGKSDIEKEYTIYLFERILLCCKEINPNKTTKDKLSMGQKDKKAKDRTSKDKNKDKGGKLTKLQLKGRIFMTNVTDVIASSKPGSHTVQIWWKGDPAIENFVIRFSNEEVMRKWSAAVEKQKRICIEREQSSTGRDIAPEFAWMHVQGQEPIVNPYAEQDDDDDDDELPHTNGSSFVTSGDYTQQGLLVNMNRNASTTSLRSRSTTGDSTQSLAGMVRQPPPRFPMPGQPLSLQTQMPGQGPSPSPGPRGGPIGDSYFSPVVESPTSSRTSQGSMYPFPRQSTPQQGIPPQPGAPQGWQDPTVPDMQNRYTAPAQTRAPSRGSQLSINNYEINGTRGPQRPSLPVMTSQPGPPGSQRSRSYSTPDINAPLGGQPRRQQGIPAVPGIPPHLHAAYDPSIPRSSNNSSPINGLPVRSATQSPGIQRQRLEQRDGYPAAYASNVNGGPPPYNRSNTSQIPPIKGVDSRIPDSAVPPPPSGPPASALPELPTQLKVKVNCDGNYITLVVAFNITYQSLVDRIDAKVGRFSTNSIGRGTMRLRYMDEDGDLLNIEGDEDVGCAFWEWKEQQQQRGAAPGIGEIELFCASVDN